VDLAGHYANCQSIGTRGRVTVSELTPDGAGIVGAVDYTDGPRSDVDAVNDYIKRVVDRWVSTRLFDAEIRGSEKFGCSVRPGCSGQVSISCLFSGSRASNIERPIPNPPGGQDALAFTAEQYVLAERITGNRWDRSHFLENLSGYETDCAMLDARDWPFSKAQVLAQDAGLRILGTYGTAPNQGSTPNALTSILQNFKQIRYANKVGCSIIPDCMQYSSDGRSSMHVVVSCLYEEN
jgi:hypothetical protein